jgi:hypothetical protein
MAVTVETLIPGQHSLYSDQEEQLLLILQELLKTQELQQELQRRTQQRS